MRIKTPANSMLCFSILIALGFIWGTGYSIARFAMTNGVPPLGYSFWQSIGPAMLVGFIAGILGHLPHFSLQNARFYLICGLMGIAIPNTSMYFAAPHLPASILAMVVNIVPIMAYPMALYARLEIFNWQRAIGILFAIGALMLIILPKSSLPSPEMVPWVLASLITPASFAFCSIYIARHRPQASDVLTLTTGMLVASSLLLIPLVSLTHQFYWLHVPLLLPDWIILLEIFLSSLGYLLFFLLLKIAGPVYYSLVDTIVVLTGLFWGKMIFNEQLNHWTGTAVCLIMLALLIVTRQQRMASVVPTLNNA